jgi:hypothetical protein
MNCLSLKFGGTMASHRTMCEECPFGSSRFSKYKVGWLEKLDSFGLVGPQACHLMQVGCVIEQPGNECVGHMAYIANKEGSEECLPTQLKS